LWIQRHWQMPLTVVIWVDVFEMEPPLPMDHPLLHSINTIVTPHIAFASDESMEIRAKIVFENIQKWMNKEQVNTIL